jgi:capsular exopolysaccharide synthesis family protein
MSAVSDTDNNRPAPTRERDLQRLMRITRERRLVIVAAVVVGALVYIYWASHQRKVYEALATVIANPQPPQVFGQEVRDVVPMGPGLTFYMQEYMQTQRRVLTSDSLVGHAIDRLKLAQDREFWQGEPPARREEQVAAFASALRAELILETQIVQVYFRHNDPKQAKRCVDGVIDEYIEQNLETRDDSTMSVSHFLASQGDELRNRLTDAEMALYTFKRDNDLLSVSLEDRLNNVQRQIDKLTDALTEARLRKVVRSSEASELNKMAAENPGSVSTAGGDPLGTLKHDLIEEERRLSELKARYQDPHPLVRQQAAKVESVQAAVKREARILVRGAEGRTNEATDQERKIATQLEAAKQEGLRITLLEVGYNKLKREAEAISKQYLLVQNRTKEAELASTARVNNLRVLDYARLPGAPIAPHLRRAAFLMFLASLAIGLALALLLDALDRSLKSQEDVETRLGLPFLGLVPHVDAAARERVVFEDPQSPAAEFLRLIRTNLMFAGLTRQLRRLVVTSPSAREGKTFTTVSLGIVMAQSGQKVLLIDGDLRRPQLAAALGVDGQLGLTNVLLGSTKLEDAIQPTGVPNLSVICSGPLPPNPAELVDGPKFRELIDRCAEGFERVIVDSPPAGPVTDPAILAGYCDGVLLVLRSRRTASDHALRVARALVDTGARIVGAVLNGVDISSQGYGRYAYSYSYKTRRQGDNKRQSDKRQRG